MTKVLKDAMSDGLNLPIWRRIGLIMIMVTTVWTQNPPVTRITTIAGGGFGSNVPARLAPMARPRITLFDPLGRGLYVVDEVNGTCFIRFANTTNGTVTIAGTTIEPQSINLIAGGGTSTDNGVFPRDADLADVTGLAVSPDGKLLFVTIPAYFTIRVINVGTEPLESYGRTIQPRSIETLVEPNHVDFRGIGLNRATGEIFFIAGRVVYRVNRDRSLTIVAGGGTPAVGNGDGGEATGARLVTPMGLAFDANNNLLIADGGDPRSTRGTVRRVSGNGIISSVASDLDFPTGIATGPGGDIFLPLGNAQQVMRIAANGTKSVVAGNDSLQICDQFSTPSCGDGGPARSSYLNLPDSTSNVTITPAINDRGLILPDYQFKRVRFVNLGAQSESILGTSILPQQINTVIGSGQASPFDGAQAVHAELLVPTGIATDAAGNLFIADTLNSRLRFVNRTSMPVTLFVTTPFATTVQPGQIVTLNRDFGDLVVDQRITTAGFSYPQGLAATSQGVIIVDSQNGALIKTPPNSISGRRSSLLRFLNTSNAPVTLFPDNPEVKVIVPPGYLADIAGVRPPANPQEIGDGLVATRVAFFATDVEIDSSGNILLADQGNNRVRRIDARTGIVSTIIGDGNTATLSGPTGIAIDGADRILVADTRNNRILRQDSAGAKSFTVIGNQSLGIGRPRDLAVDQRGIVYFANAASNQIMKLEATGNGIGTLRIVAGNGMEGFAGDGGAAEASRLNLPDPGTAPSEIQLTANLLLLNNGDLLFADSDNHRIRQISGLSGALPMTSVSAASYAGGELATESIVAAFGASLANGTQAATAQPLPTSLSGTRITITDALGIERLAPLFFVSPQQVNYQIPATAVLGPALITATSGNGTVSSETLMITRVAPGIFSANASGRDVAAALVLRVRGDGSIVYETAYQYDSASQKFVPAPIDVGPESDQLILVLFGSGFRYRSSLGAVNATIGGEAVEALYAGPAPDFVGLDQCNIRLPRRLAGRGLLNVALLIDGKSSNGVSIRMK